MILLIYPLYPLFQFQVSTAANGQMKIANTTRTVVAGVAHNFTRGITSGAKAHRSTTRAFLAINVRVYYFAENTTCVALHTGECVNTQTIAVIRL